MKSVIGYLRRNLLLVVALGSSLLLITFGLILIYNAPNPSTETAIDSTSAEALPYDIPPLPEVDRGPPADLSSVQAALDQMATGVVPTGQNFSPEVIAEALAAVEVGSETWCDIMLLKADAEWTEAESQQFAQHCI